MHSMLHCAKSVHGTYQRAVLHKSLTVVSYHGAGHVAHWADAAGVCVPALTSHAPQIVPVQHHTDHPVLELLGDDVVQNDV